jgi:uncharacterized membrane protein YdbT with pleckstrin-like domain
MTDTPEWLSLDDGETVEWVGEPELASKAGELTTGITMLPLLGLGLLVLVPAYLQVENTDYVVTNQSAYAKSGILSTNIQSLELDKIQNTEYSQSFVEKQLGYGSVGLDTAGSGDVEVEFEAIADAREVQEQIRELAKQYRGSAAETAESGDATRAGPGPLADVADELERTREALENVDAAIQQALAAQQSGGDASGEQAERGGGATGDARAGDTTTGDARGERDRERSRD